MLDGEVPTARIAKVEAAGCEVSGPGLVRVVGGELVARSSEAPDVVRLEAGDVLAVAPGRRVRCASRRAPAEVVLLEVDPAWCESILGLAGIRPGRTGSAFFVERAGSQGARLASRLLRRLSDPDAGQGASARLEAAALAVESLSMVFRDRGSALQAGSRRSASERRHPRFLAAVEALRTGDLERVSLVGFARQVDLSPRQASRLFREEIGHTFREHVAELRIERARRLLAETERSIVEVAGETGWSSLAHFNWAFRRRVGTTPSAYRFRAQGASSPPRAAAR